MVVKKNIKEEITIKVGSALLSGFLHLPAEAKGIVIFVHGSGSSRFSSRNQLVSQFLIDQSLATLLFDLLTPTEEALDEQTRELRFNIPFLTERLYSVTDWVLQHPETHHLKIGYFGSSTGAAAALVAAAELGPKISALVSRGGRPDLAGESLRRIQAPTLLIVGGNDYGVIELNEKAFALLSCTKKLEIIPQATHLFQEPGTLEQVAHKAAIWFSAYL